MGVPKLYAWLTQRYPQLVRDASGFPLPHFNNLYLDLNGVLHKCTHGNRSDLEQAKVEKDILCAIFAYIEKLFMVVQPDKLLYIAIDGVAPRAKMNQQRQRRYKTSRLRELAKQRKRDDRDAKKKKVAAAAVAPSTEKKDEGSPASIPVDSKPLEKSADGADDAEAKLLKEPSSSKLATEEEEEGVVVGDDDDEEDELLADESYFDSNCITPGTEFMKNVGDAIQYFIKRKVSEDPAWAKLSGGVIFSGAEVPGEGEHKIAAFIRDMQAQKTYDPNTSHCIYGLDADLVMIGLSLHSSDVSIIREKVVLQRGRDRGDEGAELQFQSTKEFEFLHIGLLRNYLQADLTLPAPVFVPQGEGAPPTVVVPNTPPLAGDVNRLVDDFVFLCNLIGNDFIPCLPGVAIDEGGLNALIRIYKDIRVQLHMENPANMYLVDTTSLCINSKGMSLLLSHLLDIEAMYLRVRIEAEETEQKEKEAEAAKNSNSGINSAVSAAAAAAAAASSSDQPKEETKPKGVDSASATAALKALIGLTGFGSAPAASASAAAAPPPAAEVPLPAIQPKKEEAKDEKKEEKKDKKEEEKKEETAGGALPPPKPVAINADGEVLPLPSATIQLSKGGAPVMPGAGASPFVAAAASPSQSAAQRHALEATAALKTLLSVMTEKEKQQLTKEKDPKTEEATAALKSLVSKMTEKEKEASASPATLALKQLVSSMQITEQNRLKYYSFKQKGTAVDEADAAVPIPFVRAQIGVAWIDCLFWCLHYYYRGVPSWGAFYPFLYAPLASDLKEMFAKNLADPAAGIKPPAFLSDPKARGEPFTPLQQLLAVLPPESASLLPPAYRPLVSGDAPVLIKFFPRADTVELIKDERNREWKAFLKLRFIDASALIAATTAIPADALNPAETARNKFGDSLLFKYSAQVKEKEKEKASAAAVVTSSFVTLFPPLPTPHQFSVVSVPRNFSAADISPAGQKASVAVKKSFPTLDGVTFTPQIVPTTRSERAVLRVNISQKSLNAEKIAETLIGQTVVIGWPYLNLAKLHSLETAKYIYSNSKRGKSTTTPTSQDQYDTLVRSIRNATLTTKGVDIGETWIVAHVSEMESMSVSTSGGEKGSNNPNHSQGTTPQLVRTFAAESIAVPFHLVFPLAHHPQLEERFKDRSIESGGKLDVGVAAIYLAAGSGSYGCLSRVKAIDPKTKLAEIEVQALPKGYDLNILRNFNSTERWQQSNQVAKLLNLNGLALARMTSSLHFRVSRPEGQKGFDEVDLGLGLKFSRKRLLVPGYVRFSKTREGRDNWEYSEKAIALIREYKQFAPDLFAGIEKQAEADEYDALTIFGESYSDRIDQIRNWLACHKVSGSMPLLPCDAHALSNEAIEFVQKESKNFLRSANAKASAVSKVPVSQLYAAALGPSAIASRFFQLGDRVVNLGYGAVPFGLAGTVITLHQNVAEVVFDSEFLSGSNLHNRLSELRGIAVPTSQLLNLCQQPMKAAEEKAKSSASASGGGGKSAGGKGGAAGGKKNLFEMLGDD